MLIARSRQRSRRSGYQAIGEGVKEVEQKEVDGFTEEVNNLFNQQAVYQTL